MDFNEMTKRANEISDKYDLLNFNKRGKTWNEQDIMAGFVGDVGELSQIIMAKSGLRDIENVDEKLAHELSDCLWSIVVLASKYKIDLSAEFIKTMDSLEQKINQATDR